MSISFSCDCGKKLAAKETFAGRRLKCPGCGKALTIPARRAAATQLAGVGSAAVKTGAAKTVIAPSEFLHFACTCGRKMRAREADAGLEIDCPSCGQEMAIPHANGATLAATKGAAPWPPLTKRASSASKSTSKPIASGLVRFACSCSRKLKARRADVGLAIDCPACGREMTIPHPDDVVVVPAAVKDTAPKLPPITKRIDPIPLSARTPAAPITTKTAAAPPPLTAKTVPDPKTSHPGPAPVTSRAVLGPVAPRTGYADTLVTQHLTPWRDDAARRQAGKAPREKKVRSLLVLPLVALIAAGLIGGEWYLAHESRAHPQLTDGAIGALALIPDKAVSVTTIRVADIVRDQHRPQGGMKALVQDYVKKKDIDWEPKDIARFTVVLMESDPARPPRYSVPDIAVGGKKGAPQKAPPPTKGPTTDEVSIVETRTPFVEEIVLLHMLHAGSEYFRVRVGKHGYWRPHKSMPDTKAVYFVDAQTFVVGTIAGVEHFVREQATDGIPPPLETMAKAALYHDFVVGINLTTRTPFAENALIPSLKAFRTAVVMKDEVRDSQTKERTWSLRMVYGNPEHAMLARRDLDQQILKMPAAAAQVEVVGSTLQVTLQVVGDNDADVAPLMGNVLGIVNRDSRLRKR
jgi:predicted RNA-binding Zn-ribbon protein involved in translation (DUF1610 family)